jgi:hypothetical protein
VFDLDSGILDAAGKDDSGGASSVGSCVALDAGEALLGLVLAGAVSFRGVCSKYFEILG